MSRLPASLSKLLYCMFTSYRKGKGRRFLLFDLLNKIIKAMSRRSVLQNYRIIDQTSTQPAPYLPALSNPKMLQTYTKSLLKSRQFLYIDVHEEAGYNLMKECESSDDEDEVEKVGNRYNINLNNLNSQNAKGVCYVFREKEESKKKQHALNLLREGLRRSTERIKKIYQPETYPVFNTSLENRRLTGIRSELSNYSNAQTLSPNQSTLSKAASLSKPYPNLSKPFATLSTTRSLRPPSPTPQMTTFRLKRILPDIKKYRRALRL